MTAHRTARTLGLLALLFNLTAGGDLRAHGPDGEHHDAPAAHAPAAAASAETHSDTFELVARLTGDGLSVMVDRWDSNEPVLDATLDVTTGGVTARAQFHADHGDYAFADPALLAALSQPGEHALRFTVHVGDRANRVDAVLRVEADSGEPAATASAIPSTAWVAAAVLALAAAAFLARRIARGKAVRA